MTRFVLTCAAAIALIGASPSPSATPGTLTVLCAVTPFYYYPRFASPTDSPVRSSTPPARAGQTFAALGTRTTLQSVRFVETNISANLDPSAAPHSRLWLRQTCVSAG